MPKKTAPNVGLSFGWVRAEDFWGGPMNDDIVTIDSLLFPLVQSLTFTTPPDTAVEGMMYVVATNGAGLWAGQDGKLALLIEGAWKFMTPKEGWRIRAKSYNDFLWFDGTSWLSESDGSNPVDPTDPGTDKPTAYDIGVTISDDMYANEAIVHLPVLDAMILPPNMAGSSLDMINAAVGFAVLRVQRNGQNVGAITIAAGQYNATFTTSSGNPVSFAIQDRLTIRGPDVVVAGLKNFGFVIRLKIV